MSYINITISNNIRLKVRRIKNKHTHMNYRLKLNQVKEVLGMEIKMETVKLIDGITIVEVEKLEPGFEAYIIAEDGSKTLAPAGEHTLEDGRYIEVDANGVIMEVSTPDEEVEDDVVEVSGSKKFEDAVAEEEISVAMAEMIDAKCAEIAEAKVSEKAEELAKKFAEEKVAEIIEEKMKMIFEVVDEVANEVATIKEEMGAFKAKFEKFAKAPAAGAPNKITSDIEAKFSDVEARAEFLKGLMSK